MTVREVVIDMAKKEGGRSARGRGEEAEPFNVRAVNSRYGTAKMSDVALALMRPRDPKVAAIIEARRDELADV